MTHGTVISSGTVSSCACEVGKICKQEHGSADIADHYWSQKQTWKPQEDLWNETTSVEFGHFTTQWLEYRIGCVVRIKEEQHD